MFESPPVRSTTVKAPVGAPIINNVDVVAQFDSNSNEVDQKLLHEKSEQGQNYRKQLLQNRAIIIVGLGDIARVPQYKYMMDEIGMYLFLVDDKSSPTMIAMQGHNRAIHVNTNMKSDNIVNEICDQLKGLAKSFVADGRSSQLNQQGNKVKGVFSGCVTLFDDTVCLTSRIRDEMKFVGDSAKVVDMCHDKLCTRETVTAAGLPGPKCRLLKCKEDVIKYAPEFRYPIVIKPINGGASLGVHKIESADDFIKSYEQHKANLEDILKRDELMGLVFNDTSTSYISSKDNLTWFSAEEWIGGKEYDIDIVLSEGELTYGKVQEDWDFKKPWMLERGMHAPADIPSDVQETLCTAARDCVKVMGGRTGLYHVEMKLPETGPELIEINPRLGGHGTWYNHKQVWQVDLLLEMCLVHCGLPSNPESKEGTHIAVAVILFASKTGILREDIDKYNKGIEDKMKYMTCLNLFKYKGEQLYGWDDDDVFPSEIGRMDFLIPKDKMSIDEARIYSEQFRQMIKIPYTFGDETEC